ncbi:hypothetical protein EDD36DRAFT_489978 [Exophiala viscosa]|uniref:ZZ-type domain-containing protein n=1 Tax=Exophiala viscosa TaxID=2486360 RepID=A0AAN6DPW9_9EURO|nr:hypothetical protein EDD36DRAFT_489978 [Exophiala viscosa]
MDPVSAAASILSVVKAASTAVKGAEAFWHAPHELWELNDELEQITGLATFLKWATAQHDFENTDVTSGLAKTQQALESAKVVVDTKFRKSPSVAGLASDKFGRRKWLRHHGSVKRLKHDLIVSKRDLATTVDILSILTTDRTLLLKHQTRFREIFDITQASARASTCTSCGVHASLCSSCQPQNQPYFAQFKSIVTNVEMTRIKQMAINGQGNDDVAITSRESSQQLSRLAQELENLRSTMVQNQQTSMEAVNDIAEELRQQQNKCNGLLLRLMEFQGSLRHQPTSSTRNDALTSGPANNVVKVNDNPEDTDLPPHVQVLQTVLETTQLYSAELSEMLSEKFYTPCASIADFRFEMSESFFPEQYVPEGPFDERIAVLSMMEQYRAVSVKVDKFFLLYAETPRRWRRVTVLATTIVSPTISTAFDVRAGSSLDHSCKTLPQSIHKPLEALLATTQLFNSVTNVAMQLEVSPLQEITFDKSRCLVSEDLKEAEACETSLYLTDIEHIGCPQFLESEIVVYWRISSSSYIVLAEAQVCIERIVPFADSNEGTNHVSEFMKDLWTLFELKDCRGVASLVGIVVDDTRRQIKSYLQICPELGSVQQILERASLSQQVIPWSRREKWIRHIIAAVAEVHSKGKVVGCIEVGATGVSTDDSTFFTKIAGSGNHWPNRRGYLPPELRRETAYGALSHNKTLTFQSDIFQLGLVIWLIAKHSSTVCGIFCRVNDCATVPHYGCSAAHSNPVDLPRCGRDLPAWVDEVVTACRAADPARRPPAARLIRTLPPDIQPRQDDNAKPLPANQVAESLRDRYSFSVNCDECGMLCTDLHYHCSICNLADFDICSQCFLQGIRCFDDKHDMIRRVSRNALHNCADKSASMASTTDTQVEAEALQKKLRSALWFQIGKIVDEESINLGVNATPQFIGSLMELVWAQIGNAAIDLESFAKHAGRSKVQTDDVMLLTRRNEGLEMILKEELGKLEQAKKKETKKK